MHGGSAGHSGCRMPWRSPDTQHDVRTSAPAVPLSRSVRQSGWEASVDCEQRGSRSERLVQTRGQCERAAEWLQGEQLGQTSVPADVRSTLADVQDASKARGAARRQQRDTLGGWYDAGQPSLPTHRQGEEGAPAAVWRQTAAMRRDLGVAWRENPWTLAQRGLVNAGCSPA